MNSDVIDRVMAQMADPVVLVDVGASGAPPAVWQPLAKHSIYVGFDPDQREMRSIEGGAFRRAVTLPYAIVSKADAGAVSFYLTRSPFCSSTLPPEIASLSNYLFAPLFEVDQIVEARGKTLSEALNEVSVDRADWVKTDSQGTDLRVFLSLSSAARGRVLALDIEPGLIDAYQGEDLFVDAHAELVRQGFWLSRINVLGAVRVKTATVEALRRNGLSRQVLERGVRQSPGWVEARYLRTPEWLAANRAGGRELALLWLFSIIDEQPAFALDVTAAYEAAVGSNDLLSIMRVEALSQIRRQRWQAHVRRLASRAIEKVQSLSNTRVLARHFQ